MDGAGPCGHLPSVASRQSWIHHHRCYCRYRQIDDHLAVAEAKSHAQAAALQSVVCKTQRRI